MKIIKYLDEHLEVIIGVTLLLVICVVMTLQIFMRYIMNNSLSWSEELCRYCFIYLMYLLFPCSVKNKTDLRVDGLLNIMPRKLRNIVETIDIILGFALVTVLFIFSFKTVSMSYALGDRSTAMELPMWILYLCTVGGFGLGVLRYVQRIIGDFKALKNKEVNFKW